MSYYINRGLTAHKRDNWMAQPVPMAERSPWELLERIVLLMSVGVCATLAVVMAVVCMGGGI